MEPKTGQMISKIVRAPDVLTWWIACAVDYFLPQVIAFIFATAYFWYYDVGLAATMMIMVAAVCCLIYIAPHRCAEASIERENTLDAVHEDVEDLLRNLVSVYSNDTGKDEVLRLHASGNRFVAANAKTMACMIKFNAIGVPLIVLFVLCIVTRSCHLIQTGRLQTGTFVSIFMMATSMIQTLNWLVSIIGASVVDVGIIADAEKLLSRNDKTDRVSRPGVPPPADGIGLACVTFMHRDTTTPVISNTNIHFEQGQWTIITGNIGSGKSTILKLLMAFVTPQEGDLYAAGHWYSDMSPKHVRRLVAYMPQDAILFDRTIAENILYGSSGKTTQDVYRIANELGVWDEFAALPDALDTVAGKNGSRLSGGQRQLVWFIRVALREPEYIIMDEPTASMDASTKRLLLNAMRKLGHEKTVIMVTHDPDLMRYATRRVNWEKQ